MADALRAARARSGGFHAAHRSASGRDQPAICASSQAETLAGARRQSHRLARYLDDVPDGPLLLVANEFFDALPIRQFSAAADGWHERVVIGSTAATVSPSALRAPGPALAAGDRRPAAPRQGTIVEISPGRHRAGRRDRRRVARHGGAALIIDYGHDGSGTRRHAAGGAPAPATHDPARPIPARPTSPPMSISPRLARAAARGRRRGPRPHPPGHASSSASGISARAPALRARATPAQARRPRSRPPSACSDPEQMGTSVQGAGDRRAGPCPPPPGFDDPPAPMIQADRPQGHAPRIRHGFFTRQGGVSRRHLRLAQLRPRLEATTPAPSRENRRRALADGSGAEPAGAGDRLPDPQRRRRRGHRSPGRWSAAARPTPWSPTPPGVAARHPHRRLRAGAVRRSRGRGRSARPMPAGAAPSTGVARSRPSTAWERWAPSAAHIVAARRPCIAQASYEVGPEFPRAASSSRPRQRPLLRRRRSAPAIPCSTCRAMSRAGSSAWASARSRRRPLTPAPRPSASSATAAPRIARNRTTAGRSR